MWGKFTNMHDKIRKKFVDFHCSPLGFSFIRNKFRSSLDDDRDRNSASDSKSANNEVSENLEDLSLEETPSPSHAPYRNSPQVHLLNLLVLNLLLIMQIRHHIILFSMLRTGTMHKYQPKSLQSFTEIKGVEMPKT